MAGKKVAAGIDIGATNSVYGIVDRKGNILAEGAVKTAQYPHPGKFAETLFSNISAALGKFTSGSELAGIGIGVPMGNINKGTIEYPASLPWKGITPLAELFSIYTTLPVIITNDANAAAVGEMIYGGAKEMKDFVVLTLGTGLGSGFVVNGKLVYGNGGFAGELGHTAIIPGYSDRECGCGKKGCTETYVSATGLKRTLFEIMARSIEPSPLRRISYEEIDAKIIYEAAVKGDPLALKAFDFTGMMLGVTCANVVAYTSPEAIFLFGGLTMAKDFIFAPARRYMEENLLSIYRGKVKLLPSAIEEKNAAVLGASSLVWSQLERS